MRIRSKALSIERKRPIVGSVKWSAVAFVTANSLKIQVALLSLSFSLPRSSESTIGTPRLILTAEYCPSDAVRRESATRPRAAFDAL